MKVTINFSKRWLYTFIAIGILAIIGVGVYAVAGVSHSSDELDVNWDDILGMPAGFADGSDDTGSVSTNPLYVEGAITSPAGTIRDANGGWLRTYGNTGWYSGTYGGGWYMIDSSWIRAYNNKNVEVGALKVNGAAVTVESSCDYTQWGEIRKCTASSYKQLICACTSRNAAPRIWRWKLIVNEN